MLVQFPTPLNVRTTLAGDTSLVQGIFIEAVLTAELVFTILMLAKEEHKVTFIAPVGIGLALFIAELVGVFYTGGSLDPARNLVEKSKRYAPESINLRLKESRYKPYTATAIPFPYLSPFLLSLVRFECTLPNLHQAVP